MKISLAVSGVLLAVFLAVGWRNHCQLQLAEIAYQQLEKEALELSITPGSDSGPRVTKRLREKRESDARQLTTEVIGILKEGAHKEDAAVQERITGLRARIEELDAAELKVLVAVLDATAGLKGEDWDDFVRFSLETLAAKSPREALALFARMPDLYDRLASVESVIASALFGWANDDPVAAVDWFRKNAKDHPDQLSDWAKVAIVSGAAEQDPGQIFKVGRELGMTDWNMDRIIPRSVQTDEGRISILKAMREHLGTISDAKEAKRMQKAVIGELVHETVHTGFNAASQWLVTAKLSPYELGEYATRLGNCGMYDETGSWINWMNGNLPADQRTEAIQTMVASWSRTHYKAAGKWLTTAPDGPVKTAAIRGYAETVSSHEPANAVQWALTMPAGKDREETLESIYSRWPKEDPASRAAAEAFAKEHGIK